MTSADSKVWNVVTYVTESKEFGTLFNLTAYTQIPSGLYLRGGGSGGGADAEGEALAILASFREQR